MDRIRNLFLLLVSLFAFTACANLGNAPSSEELVDFNFEVRPVLVQKCFLCHGPDPSSRKANLRFDTYEGATALLKEGRRAIVPGHPDSSGMVKRILSKDPDFIMPTPESHLTLTEAEKETLVKWIEQGAKYKPHWAFIQPKAPDHIEIPESGNEIDFFINQKLDKLGLETSPMASKNVLIRRVSYLLTGLPPTPAAVGEFVADQSPDAYDKMVDGYLNSQHFGERWARHWMDVVRYAETKGHEFDYTISGAWRYRDYLIRAFNSDVPYDQLVKEHLAGDLLPLPRRDYATGSNESRIATTFYAFGEGTHSPVDVRKDEADRIDNMVDVTTKTFQSLTVACARCHDHKFDPITTKDYYALYGVMESTRFSPVPAGLTTRKEQDIQKLDELKTYIRKTVAEEWGRENKKESLPIVNATLRKDLPSKEGDYQLIGDFRGADLQGWKSDGRAFGQGTTLGKPVFDPKKKEIIALEEGMASSRILSTGVFGALRSPNFVISNDFIGVQARGKNASIRIIIDNFQLISYPIYGEMDQKVNTESWNNFKFNVGSWKGHKAYVEIMPGVYENHVYKLPADAYVDVRYAVGFDKNWTEPVPTADLTTFTIGEAVDDWAAGNASAGQVREINVLLKKRKFRKQFPQLIDLLDRSNELAKNLADTTFYNAIYEGFGINSPVFKRGSHLEPSVAQVPRGFISAVPVGNNAFKSPGSGRMELAAAIVNPKNPITSRVMVNRIWHHLFGKGIVETVDNFGLQGKLPTNPALLDYLAIRYQQEGWSTKKLIRLIVSSDAFKRAVSSTKEVEKNDPENLWLARFPRRRLEAEDIRDAMLASAGNLNPLMYGAPVPVYVTQFMQGRGKPSKSGPLDGNGRRSIYQEIRRNFMQPMMLTFDQPAPFSTFGNRNVTNVPAQSLILMNDPFVIKQAEIMANTLLSNQNLDMNGRLQWIYNRTLSRNATEAELKKGKDFIHKLALLQKVPANKIMTDPRVWRDYCHSIFNLKEFIYLI
ncbi:MAG: PSD1 and planctomycete cytochrome C domain-containing protein [Dyadobacter sp.]|uniref:PSD1 and planctomycete cytochrome C domain-containing protein n=1 Tax=Dyadobacter sp. TaxID=1914288 RepID=UPI0032647C9F